jgi:hypothetical protein
VRALRSCALVVALLAVGCFSGDDQPEVAGVEIERDDVTTTTSSTASSSTSSTTTTTSTTTVAPTTTSTSAAPRTTTTTRPPARPTTTTTTTSPPPTVAPAQPGEVEGVLVVADGTRARLFLVDTNTETVRGSDELPSSGEFSFGDVVPGDYRVDTSAVAADGATSEDRGVPFQLGQASTVRLTCDPRCAPA